LIEKENRTWDVYSGVGEGALNAYLMALYSNDEGDKASERVEDFWKKLGDSKVYNQWSLGVLEGYLMKDGLFNIDPLHKLLDKELGQNLTDKPAKSMLNLGIVDLNNGTFVSFNDKFKNRDLMHALKASVANPSTFEPYQAWNSSWIAGQSIWDLEASAPILRCLAKGFK
jgi:predicted acylesterase/phospholipase RssA